MVSYPANPVPYSDTSQVELSILIPSERSEEIAEPDSTLYKHSMSKLKCNGINIFIFNDYKFKDRRNKLSIASNKAIRYLEILYRLIFYLKKANSRNELAI